MKIQGDTIGTRLRHTMRQMRGAYLENVRSGLCKLDKKVLREFDDCLKDANERFKRKA